MVCLSDDVRTFFAIERGGGLKIHPSIHPSTATDCSTRYTPFRAPHGYWL